jgi:hypothetical protein
MRLFSFFATIALSLLFSQCNEATQPVTVADPYKWTSGITSVSTDSQTVENLVVLGRVWGFLKYYHPVVASGKYNWDYELFKVMPKVIAAKNRDERNAVLALWIDSLGTFAQQDSAPVIDSANVKLWPDYSWIDEAILGKKLTNELEQVRTARRDGKNHYVKLASGVSNPIFLNESEYDSLQFPDAGYRLLSLFRYWNSIEYFYPYKHLIGTSWSSVLNKYLPRFIGCKSEYDYESAVSRLIAEIHDTHAGRHKGFNTYSDLWGTYYVPVRLASVENKPTVVGFYDSTNDCGLQMGDVIVSVEDQVVDSVYASVSDDIHASNLPTALRNLNTLLLSSKASTLHVVYERDGCTHSIDLVCKSLDDSLSLRNKKSYWREDSARLVDDGIWCVFPANLDNALLAKAIPRIQNDRALIIDFRCYPKEPIMVSLTDFIFTRALPFNKLTFGNIEMPGLFTFSDLNYFGRNNPVNYKGKIVVLVNEETQSQAEYTTLALRAAPNVTIMGSTTAGADGNVSTIGLPGGLETWISGIGVYYPDGRETQRVGIVPDIEVHPTIQGIREGRDELMEAAIEYINKEQ